MYINFIAFITPLYIIFFALRINFTLLFYTDITN